MSKKRGERRTITAVDRRVDPARTTRANAEKSPGRRSEVIIVEEDKALAELISFALHSHGHLVKVFNDGVGGLTALARLPVVANRRLLLLSVDLGGIDGHTLHEKLNELRPGAFMVAFMSVRSSDADQVRALRAGAVDYLVKPISMQVLLEKVRVWEALIAGEA